ncbi:SCAN domain-containing protein 3-like 15, partial [Homarus americanus]
ILPAALQAHLETVIKTINFIKGSTLKTRLFRELCKIMFHAQVRWMSKGNMLIRFYELSKEVKTFLIISEDFINQVLKAKITEHLNSLIVVLPRHNTNQITMALTRDPFLCHVDDVPTKLQEDEFWVKMRPIYPGFGNNALRVLITFSSTYLCESSFSSLLSLKSKTRNKLQVECDLRCALSVTAPQIAKIVAKKQKTNKETAALSFDNHKAAEGGRLAMVHSYNEGNIHRGRQTIPLRFVQAYVDARVEFWRSVIFTDEKRR